MGTNGPRRPTSETFTVPSASVEKSASPWLESLICPEPEDFGESAHEEAATLHPTCFERIQIVQHAREHAQFVQLASSEYDFVETSTSLARGCLTNPERDPTPRNQAAEPSGAPLLTQGSTHDLPPIRQESQDSAYASAMDNEYQQSTMDVDLQATNIRARERVEITRGRVLQMRRAISDKRQELQFLRETLRDATDKLMRAVREVMVQDDTSNLRSLEPHYQELSAAQDALGPAEYAYDLLETRLSRAEDELEDEEVNFYTRNNIRLAPQSETKLDKFLTPRPGPHQPEQADVPTLNLASHLERDYLTKLSEAGILKEDLHDLEDQQYELINELAFRSRHNLQLSQEKATFLFEFPSIHRNHVERLERVEDDLYELRERCLAQNLFSESEYAYEPYDALVEGLWESVNDFRDRSPLYAHYVPHTVNFADKQDYVNTWLLESMQESTIELMQLKSFIHAECAKHGQEVLEGQWSDLALGFWNQDSAGEFANSLKRSTIDVLLGGTGSSLEIEDWGGPVVVARSLSPQKDVGIDLAHVDRVQSGQKPIRRRKRGPDSRARSV